MRGRGHDWTGEEVDACVTAYFENLAKDIAGEPFVKSHLYRALTSEIPRSEKSIEYKFQNISAILNQLGLEWIRGLAPASNYQRRLADAVERRLPAFLAHRPLTPENSFEDLASIYLEPAPERESQPRPVPEYIERLARKFDPVERDSRNRELGLAGEQLALHFERHTLKAHQRDDLVRKVRWVSQEDGDGAGYDILSFEPDGREKFIEVKTTVGGNRTPFFITRVETDFSREAAERFHLFRLYDFRREPKAFAMNGAIDKYVRLTAQSYRADFEA